jgi:hypothetical protein
MGNELENALPRCQLIRLQNLAEEVDYRRRNEPPPSLSINERLAVADDLSDISDQEPPMDRNADTELVGFWVDTLCVPVGPDELRIGQIGKMRHIYKDASCVLVLDRWVQSVATTADISEKFSRLYLSNWQHRLWTCQEGIFAQSLYFQLSDRQQRLAEFTEEAGLRKDGPLKCTIPAMALDIPAFNEGKLESFDLSEKVHPILNAVRLRTTTKQKDETVCIATLLGLEPAPILRVRDEPGRDICEQRMEKLMQIIKKIPQGLIFNKMERLTSPGYRWAPRTFLGQKLSGPLWEADPDFLNGEGGLLIPCHGLVVHYPAYLLDMGGEQATVLMAISNGQKHYKVHLATDATALRLRLQQHTPESEPVHRIWEHPDYAVRREKYALVTSSMGAWDAVFCAFDTILGEGDFLWPVHKLRYLCPATVEPTAKLAGAKQSWIPFRFQKKWEWVIS